ncbi:MAG: peptidoglycan-binding domain-containing protein [Candidatus Omnitrophota bacterium]
MRLIIAFMLVVIFMLAGCATGAKKKTAQSQPHTYTKPQQTYQQEMLNRSYDNEKSWSSEVYGQPAKKMPVESGGQLSIRQIQRALKKAGFYNGEIDGKIGAKTKESIIKFQKAHGLKADGIVGKRTSAELNRYLSR